VKKGVTQPEARDAASLRARAEKQLDVRLARTGAIDPETRRIVHELEVHRIELELQNEELERARVETERGLERYRSLFDFAPVGYAILSADCVIPEVNRVGARLLKRESSRLVGRSVATVVPQEAMETLSRVLATVVASNGSENCEFDVDGGMGGIPARLLLSATALHRAEEPLVLLTFRDISDRKAHEDRLLQTEQALREMDRNKNAFLSALSHELRNPLAAIHLSLAVLARSAPGADASVKALAILDRQVAHLARLTDDLLDVTRVAHGKLRLTLDRVDLGALVRSTTEDHRLNFEEKGIGLETELDGEDLWVDADATRLVQAFSNVLSNAAKFTPRGGVVAIAMHAEGGRATLRVRDSGAGIAPEVARARVRALQPGAPDVGARRGWARSRAQRGEGDRRAAWGERGRHQRGARPRHRSDALVGAVRVVAPSSAHAGPRVGAAPKGARDRR
jgi:PAS domain S-box-containing protein